MYDFATNKGDWIYFSPLPITYTQNNLLESKDEDKPTQTLIPKS